MSRQDSRVGEGAQVLGEQVRELYGKGLFPLLANLTNGVILAVVARDQEQISFERIGGWLGLLTFVTGLRLVVWRRFHVGRHALSDERWRLLFEIGLGLTGAVWGAAAVAFWTPQPGMLHALIGFVVGGMVAAVSITAGSDLRAFIAFTIPALLPIMARFAVTGLPVDAAMCAMISIFGAVMLALARRGQRWFVRNTALQANNATLIAELSAARDRLEQRVQERTAELERSLVQVRAAEEQARAAVHAREEFLAVAAHELRTPLGTLELHLSALERRLGRAPDPSTRPDDETAELAGRIKVVHRQVRRLTALANTVLAASGMKSSETALQEQEADLAAIVRSVLDDLTSYAAAGACPISAHLQEPLPGRWDPVRVEQVVMNLVSNAMKYGAGREVSVQLERRNGAAVLTVHDRGPGVPAEARDHIFERFYRAEVGQRTGGLGLGLSVVHDLVRAMGGSITVSSPPDEGATFTVQLPVK